MRYFTLLILLHIGLLVFGQVPKIAVVKPDGNTTAIFNDLTSAYNFASSGDAIYIPGGVYTINDSIRKQILFIGSGISVDSSAVTGTTKIQSWLRFGNGSNGCLFEGIDFIYPFYTGSPPNLIDAGNNSISFVNCRLPFLFGGNNGLIKNSIVGTIYF